MNLPRFAQAVLDCPDPLSLAAFYSALTGLEVERLDGLAPEEITGIDLLNAGVPALRFQKDDKYVPPTWPDGPGPQQFHIHFEVDDLEEADKHALPVGARLADFQPGEP